MEGRIGQRNPGSREISYVLGRDPLGNRRKGSFAVRGKTAQAQRELREILTTIAHGHPRPPTFLCANGLTDGCRK